ncbi:hypothetical protein [Ottowia thiooxydans]|uniref:hypothetical protein n=1 Tax=Ottowia thiooxydans TaxID=219182 RepID=UPI00040E92FC|nr:hypothetical protein [Ottowia thiooxydans]
MNLSLSHFDDLLRAARSQTDPQRLLLVFASVELPDDATPAQRAGFAAGRGGALVPMMCVDKGAHELESFAMLLSEAASVSAPDQEWVMVFVAAMSGPGGRVPTSEDAHAPLQRMTESIRAGVFGQSIAFDRSGTPVQFG